MLGLDVKITFGSAIGLVVLGVILALLKITWVWDAFFITLGVSIALFHFSSVNPIILYIALTLLLIALVLACIGLQPLCSQPVK